MTFVFFCLFFNRRKCLIITFFTYEKLSKLLNIFFVWPMIFIYVIMTGSLENLEDKNVNNDFSQVMFIY